MGTKQKAFTIAMWTLVVAGLFVLIGLTRGRDREHARTDNSTPSTQPMSIELVAGDTRQPVDMSFSTPTFKLLDQSGTEFNSDHLKGKVWTAMLFFSQCQGVCPSMRGRITALQKAVTDSRVHFVSFSVDPKNDTPERMAVYAKAADADGSRWHMLTGPEAMMHEIAAGLMMPYDVPSNHSSRILLVDQQGVVRRVYLSGSDEHMKQLASDAVKLAETGKL
ncbi:MAG: SCO family protein [Tepidisphaeraceae bacterium]